MVAEQIPVGRPAFHESKPSSVEWGASAQGAIGKVRTFTVREGTPVTHYVSRVREALLRHDVKATVVPAERVMISVATEEDSDWTRFKVAKYLREELSEELASDAVEILMNGVSLSEEMTDVACAPKITYSI